jgi:sporulation protein YlmC with PRC-barrel domain
MNRSQPTPRSGAALPARAIHLTELLHTPLVNRDGHRVGRVIDVVADRCDGRDLEITGLVAGIDDRQVFIPMKRLTLAADTAVIGSVDKFGEPYRRRPSELLLVADVLGRRLLDVRITTSNWSRTAAAGRSPVSMWSGAAGGITWPVVSAATALTADGTHSNRSPPPKMARGWAVSGRGWPG